MPGQNSQTQPVDAIIKRLWPAASAGPQVYAVIDGARDPQAALKVRLSRLHQECLFTGKISRDLAAAAPYIVNLHPDAKFTRELLALGWGRSWGFFATASADSSVRQVRRHLRQLLRVQNEQGRTLFFRFYDPRVLRRYLPTCTVAEALQFFGPIEEILVEGSNPAEILEFQPSETGTTCRTVSLN